MNILTPITMTQNNTQLPVLSYANQAVSINGQLKPFASTFYNHADDLVRIEADLMQTDTQGNVFVTPFSVPGEISTPFVKHGSGKATSEEVYFRTTITNGHIVMQGRLSSGDWKLLQGRSNQALAQIGAPFEVALSGITFFVSTPA